MTRTRAYWSSNEDENLPVPAHERADEPIRADLVARVRREIAEGTYDTPEKWEMALDRLLDRLYE